jgi:pyruvate formate lyase activating enzyme
MHEARWWRPPDPKDGKVLCTLCPRFCRVGEGQAGFCFIRRVEGGRMVSLGYGRSTGFAVDPIEKKPLNHFLPGTPILSFGTAGCNLGCKFCQNWSISKAQLDEAGSVDVTPDDVCELAERNGCRSIAFTYNDPVIFAEYVIDVSRQARRRGQKAVLVTAGYVTEEARGELYQYADAANVDLKAFTEDFYRKVTFSHLQPVLETLKWLRRETGVWLEVTNLMIPGLNDDRDETRRLCEWMMAELGPDVPLHFTAFHPDFKITDRPPTPPATLRAARALAREIGLRYVYTGNIYDPEGQTTWCPGCGQAVIERSGYQILGYRIRDNGCAGCGTRIAGLLPDAADLQLGGRRRYLGLVR